MKYPKEYLIQVLIGMLITFLLLLTWEGSFFLRVNGNLDAFGNRVFPWITRLGEWWFIAPAFLLILLKNPRAGILSVLAISVSSIMVQVLKREFFNHADRPLKYFAERGIEISTVPGVEVHSHFSFPSGHTTAAFLCFFCLAFCFQKVRGLSSVFVFLAFLTGFSRIYLGQHFISDVFVGALLGTTIACSLFLFYPHMRRIPEKGLI